MNCFIKPKNCEKTFASGNTSLDRFLGNLGTARKKTYFSSVAFQHRQCFPTVGICSKLNCSRRYSQFEPFDSARFMFRTRSDRKFVPVWVEAVDAVGGPWFKALQWWGGRSPQEIYKSLWIEGNPNYSSRPGANDRMERIGCLMGLDLEHCSEKTENWPDSKLCSENLFQILHE